MLAARRILLGISGGVAAYKAAYLARRLVEGGAEVQAMLTEAAHEFIGPQTLAAITGRRPFGSLFGTESVSPHTEAARWADAIVVAPATASILGKVANGVSDDLLSATLLAAQRPVLFAPAMHTEMWEHPATTANVGRLGDFGYHMVGPAQGPLAGGDEGIGRMAEPEHIVDALVELFADGDLAGWRVLVTAGGTREPIDPVRYLGNRSSGKMGTAIAAEAAGRGAQVTLVTTVEADHISGVRQLIVTTAEEMAEAAWRVAPDTDVTVMAAAVADFKPKAVNDQKLRRADGPPEVILEPTPDVLAGVADLHPGPFLVGFAAEAGPAALAAHKAASKSVDLVVANDITAPGSGFGSDTNQVTVMTPDGKVDEWELMSKREVARRLWDLVVEMRTNT